MARNRSGADLIDDAMKRADVEGDDDRHPRPEVLRYVNQGKAELRDLLIEARGASYFRSPTPWTITTTANTLVYTSGFPATFMRAIGVRVSEGGERVYSLEQMQTLEEPALVDTAHAGDSTPTHYDLRSNGIAILPKHRAGLTVTVDYIPASDDLLDSGSSLVDGVDGWEEYIVCFAARCIAMKDEEYELARELEREMARLALRISKLAPKRDAFRPRRVQDVRGARAHGRMAGGGRALVRGRWPR